MTQTLTVQEIDKEIAASLPQGDEYTFEKILFDVYLGCRIYQDGIKLGELWIQPIADHCPYPCVTAYSEAMREAKWAHRPSGEEYYHLSQEQKDRHSRFKDVYKNIRDDVSHRLGTAIEWEEAWPREKNDDEFWEKSELILDEELKATPQNILCIVQEHAGLLDYVVDAPQNWEAQGYICARNRLGVKQDGSIYVRALTLDISRVRISAGRKQDYWLFKSLAAHILAIVQGIKHEEGWWGMQPRPLPRPDVGATFALLELCESRGDALGDKQDELGEPISPASAALGNEQGKKKTAEDIPTIGDIRHFLTNAFDDVEFTSLCFDNFHEAYNDFTSGMTKAQKIQLLLDYCQRHESIPDLLAAIQRVRPEQYEKWQAYN